MGQVDLSQKSAVGKLKFKGKVIEMDPHVCVYFNRIFKNRIIIIIVILCELLILARVLYWKFVMYCIVMYMFVCFSTCVCVFVCVCMLCVCLYMCACRYTHMAQRQYSEGVTY